MKKVLVVLLVVCLACTAAFAAFDKSNLNLNVGLGLQSSVGLSYELGKYEVGVDAKTFYFSHLVGVAGEADELISYLGAEIYGLYEVCSKDNLSFDLGLGFINNPYRDNIVDESEGIFIVEGGDGSFAPFKLKSFTFVADAKVEYKINEKNSVSVFAELPLIGISSSSLNKGFDALPAPKQYLKSCLSLVRVEYTYSF